MALTPNSNEAFLREVDEELRRDQLATFWERWGRWVIVGVVVGLAVFGAYLYWQHRTEQAAGVQGERLQAAFDSLGANNPTAAAGPLAELAASDRDGYRALAKFTQADILLQKNDFKGAAAKLAEVSADETLAKPFRDLALVRQTTAEYDGLKPQAVIERLRPLAVPGNPWFGSAGELVAMAHLRMNRRDLAGAMFGQMARNDDVPDSIRQRAVQMAGVLGVDAVVQNEDNKAQ
ncbi:MAG TPA: tetratricopeptide repeat protein [Sphingomonas sp.]|nr:tetratricopeptide repeat protein [Sphingomonas sp.]